MKALYLITASALVLTACSGASYDQKKIAAPQAWSAQSQSIQQVDANNLHSWWTAFQDSTLNQLVDMALKDSPDRKIAEARIREARGLRKSQMGSLFPDISVGANGTRGKTQATNFDASSLYDAGFDASYELDLFGRNLNRADAADSNLLARREEYNNTSLSLVSEVARNYIEFRAAQKQALIAQSNLTSQQKTLDLVRQQKELGEAPQLDVERAEGLVHTTQSAIPEFMRQADNARLRLGVLVGAMPETLLSIMQSDTYPQTTDVTPALLSPAAVIATRPDIRAAQAQLESRKSLSKAEFANLFPTITLGGFFGVADNILIDPTRIWSTTINAALPLLNFGRIQGNIDAANAREMEAYETWRKTVLQAVADVETALTDYAHIRERLVTLRKASENAERSLTLSQQLHKEGEVSFIDVLDAQRTLNSARAEVISAEESYTLSLISLYKSLGVY